MRPPMASSDRLLLLRHGHSRAVCGVNEVPHPQVRLASGFVMRKPPPMSWPVNSTVLPRTNRSLLLSTTTGTPSTSYSTSNRVRVESSFRMYSIPEHPPPLTATRNRSPGSGFLASNCLTLAAAESVSSMGALVSFMVDR